jgi:hypothetical protein
MFTGVRFDERNTAAEKKMPIKNRTLNVLFLVIYIVAVVPVASGQTPPASATTSESVPLLIRQMDGTWDVRQRMWPAAGASAVNLPSAVAQRHLIGGTFIEEIMELPAGSKDEPFTRIAYFNYNPVNQQYEYFSIDTRAPQMMSEKSYEPSGQSKIGDRETINLLGESFVAPRWGESSNVAFRYRLEIGPVEKDHQLARLYLTPQSASGAKEFLAFEYEYTRRR